jgi:uncharacterized protein (TIGR01319 family)
LYVSEVGIFVDFGSTYTKVVAIDLDEERIVGRCQSETTVKTDITIGLNAALEGMEANRGRRCGVASTVKLACSSAAGGLRLVVIGLVPDLSLRAGRMAALGAGAKLVGNYSYKLNQAEIASVARLSPDIVLLVGGTDGGNEEVILHNAKVIAESGMTVPVIVAGNKACADEIRRILESGQRLVKVVDNVLGELDKLNVEASRTAIREVFMQRIVHAKGLDKAEQFVDRVIMPTPMAVLKGAQLLSEGAGSEKGLGELIVVDIGGATTDIHSIASGYPHDHNVTRKGIPEPFAKRTVEGDLGLRFNALSILEAARKEGIQDPMKADSATALEDRVRFLTENTGTVPMDEDAFLIDIRLARVATEIAMGRHAGRMEQVYSPYGVSFIQEGKDLTEVKTVIGAGGVFAYGREVLSILEGTLFSERDPLSLRPKAPEFYIDRSYILYAIGLLAEKEPEKALRIGKKHLERVGSRMQMASPPPLTA